MSKGMEQLELLARYGYLGNLEMQLAGLVSRIVGDADAALLTAVALAAQAVGEGNACVDLAPLAGTAWQRSEGQAAATIAPLPPWDAWQAILSDSAARKVIGTPERSNSLLILDDSRLYLRRYWRYEVSVERHITQLAQPRSDLAERNVAPLLAKYFPDDPAYATAVAQQRQAAQNAISRGISLLSGGPGTGKTYTLARIVALLAELAPADGSGLAVQIAAPTGKAAQRVLESLQEAVANLRRAGFDERLLQTIPKEATTIHRLLGSRYDSPYFKHNSHNPLAADLVIIDEASMVALPLMAKLLEALKPGCRLLLVGDANQLASVEPGSVFGDICRAAADGAPLAGCLTTLSESRRFPADSAIGHLATTINEAPASAWQVVVEESTKGTPLMLHESSAALDESGQFAVWMRQELRPYLQTHDPLQALNAFNRFRILCALRKGPYGVEQMNRRVEQILQGIGLQARGRLYDHRPVLVTVNTPALGLYNGDIGVLLYERDAADKPTGRLLAWFIGEDGAPRSIPANLLPEHETAFAMTIHKSQGSEFPQLAVVLPDEGSSPVLTRELIYTAITRVKIGAEGGALRLYSSERAFRCAAMRRTERASGLFLAGK